MELSAPGISLRALPVSLGFTREEGLELTQGAIKPGPDELDLITARLSVAYNFLMTVELAGEA